MKADVKIKDILDVIEELPHSDGRVPYTYHHDHLRQHSKAHKDMSRSQVAEMHTEDNLELYAVCLTQILQEVGHEVIYLLDKKEIDICESCKEITQSVIEKYNTNFNQKSHHERLH